MPELVNFDHSLKPKGTALVNEDHSKSLMMSQRNISPWVFIPARLGSRRLPRKPLLDLSGRPLIARVVEAVSAVVDPERIVVVSDTSDVLKASQLADPQPGQTLIISDSCHSGSDRVRRAYLAHTTFALDAPAQGEWLINVQGDEPLLPPDSLRALINALPEFERQGIKIATLAAPLPSPSHDILHDRAAVKACLSLPLSMTSMNIVDQVQAQRNIVAQTKAQSNIIRATEHIREALYFTRAPTGGHLHIGVYAYHSSILPLLATQRTPLSAQEDLEQLTWMEHGARIGVVCLTEPHPPGVDTPEDLLCVRRLYEAQHLAGV